MSDNLQAANLPSLLTEIDRDNVEQTIAKLEADLCNDEIALKLGRAFLRGRKNAFEGNAQAFDPQTPPVMPTSDECNLYAGGYQYDFEQDPNDLMQRFLQQEDKRNEQMQQDVLKSQMELQEVAAELDKQPMAPNSGLELLNRKIDLRTHIMMATINNVIERSNFTDMRIAMMSRLDADPPALPSHVKDAVAELFGQGVRRPPAR